MNEILRDFKDTVEQERELAFLDPMPDAGETLAATAEQWLDLGIAFDYELPSSETDLACRVLMRIVNVYGQKTYHV